MNQFKHLAQMALGLALALLGPHTTLAATNPGPTLQGQVVRVSDGDTVTLQTQDSTIKIRLAGIDAPETKMPHGPQAKAHLAALVLGKQVQAIVQKKDRYGRTIATLMLNTKDVNLAMVQAGMAWHYKQYEREQTAVQAASYSASEQLAQAAGRGLWSQPNAVPPWSWRQARNDSRAQSHWSWTP
jgi:endonuclease YncB( thermonuclease family)